MSTESRHGGELTTRGRLRSRLRHETAAIHAQLESQLDLLAPDLTLGRYARVVGALWGYVATLEPGLAALNETTRLECPLRERTVLLVRDLHALGASPDASARAPRDSLPRLTAPEDLVGCVYVFEGASLGGRVVAPALERRLGLTRETGCAYFSGDGQDPAPRWAIVLTWLERVATSVDGVRVVASALGRWLALRGALR